MSKASIDAMPSASRKAIAYLRSPQSIRDRSEQLFALAQADRLAYFRCDLTQLNSVADYVLTVIREQYPDLNIPFHSRWRHFEVGGSVRLKNLEQKLASLSALERAKTKFDLVVPSVLLDAGAGAHWQYIEPQTHQVWQRSEGLAVASFDCFCQGMFSSHPDHPYQADAKGLQAVTPKRLAAGFQVSDRNPLVGLEPRSHLLQNLGQSLYRHPNLFGTAHPRIGNLVDYLLEQSENNNLSATTVFQSVLEGLETIWSGRIAISGVNLGDVWVHSALSGDPFADLVPFHKLSQWLTYSLLEPLQELGLTITDLDQMTGLPEYRNGGLCLDLGLLRLKDEQLLQAHHAPGSELIVEWRSLTVSLLDRIADTLRHRLDLTSAELPLVKILQGGTWAAGRKIASQLRPGGTPPLQIISDGTVF
ncbi:URC4/urg3 family protein [Myxacorys almedinensis]|uniref:DUF1688 family protein n=1 Tax=Myxacorys almedinensis A TaxID=2690445 RepID=A0A8J7Z2R0_9CYAN|nr:URC4/urg3 family protein [Myxacorys almedinensis]NDJ18929.1 DUF1688 family protein [Myxacorys almedinensis A]